MNAYSAFDQKTNKILGKQAGFTLLEMLIVLVVIAILAALAGPSFMATIANAEVNGTRNKLASAAQFARSEALKRKTPVSVCASADQATCSNGTDWENGWLVFSDANGNGALDGGEPVLQVEYAANQLNTYNDGGAIVTFNRIGRAVTGAGDYAFCHPEQASRGRVVRITVTGSVERQQETIGGC
ncbi:MAG: GspH/FimT family pseudopilin [Pseudomonadales bacterium]